MESLVSTQELETMLGETGEKPLRVLDATIFLPGSARDAKAEFDAAHIPGAQYMDLDAIVDPESPLAHALPRPQQFGQAMSALGVSDTDRIVVYDNSPLHSAARAWWMLKAFGATDVAILDGGFPKWLAEGRACESGPASVVPANFSVSYGSDRFAEKHDLAAILHSNGHEIADARSAARFAGEEGEPRPGITAGHIPGSRNLPQALLFDADNSYKSPPGLRAAFETARIDLSKPLITTCGSGVTAAVIAFAAHLLGKEDVKLYDGSWNEWGSDPETPKAVGRE